MKNLKDILNEGYAEDRAVPGNVLEVELKNDGHFYWHTPKDDDWDDFKDMKDWEVEPFEEGFYIKIGK